jgi:hypothetical protein
LSPSGESVALQVKASDQPGVIVGGATVEGERDERVVKGMERAIKQLPLPATRASAIGIVANRTWPIPTKLLIRTLIGRTMQYEDKRIVLHQRDRGLFARARHVGAAIRVHLLRGLDRDRYLCVVVRNPWASATAQCQPEWFPRAHVLRVANGLVSWEGGEPDRSTIPVGTAIERDTAD